MSKASNVVVNNNSIGFGGLLFLVFLVLKLTNVIDWSWWWVTAPLWIPLAFFVFFLVCIFVIAMTCGVFGLFSSK
jgi:hypothetical protein